MTPTSGSGSARASASGRIKTPEFHAHGIIDPDGSIDSLYTALAAAADSVRPDRPDLAEHFDRLLDAPGDG